MSEVLCGECDETYECNCHNDCPPPDTVLNRFAHELAEKIRREAGPQINYPVDWADGMRDAANLIDPEVT